jgi:CubicO group peptidase (beta-lactamase class C family)
MKFIRLLFFSLFLFQFAVGQTWQDTLSTIDKRLSQYLPVNPGCQLSISRNGQVIFSKAWGMADLERNVPITTNSIFEAGSVSKQFTAASILLLEQQGKLSLNDNVRKYIPEMPEYGTPITLRQMLHHTSGIREWSDIVELTAWPRGKKFYTNQDVLEIIVRQKHLNNKPGDEFLYSNSNYLLFAFIVQRISGLSLAKFTQKYIFEPAGMTHTQWRDNPNRIVSNRAIAYTKSENDFEIDMPNEYVYGPGGLLTTTEDLLKWNNFYQSGKFGIPSLLLEQIKTEPLNNGVVNPYAAGLFINKIIGWDNINHDGATASYRAYSETFPELHLSIAILSNTSQFNIDNVESSIRKIFVPDRTESVKETKASTKLSKDYLNSLTGMYVNERNRSTFHLSVNGDTLMLDNYLPLRTVSGHIFKADNFLLEINGNRGLYIPFSLRDTINFTKVEPSNISERDFHIYQGKYFSEETNSPILIQRDSSKLTIRFNGDRVYQLKPTYKNAFIIDELGCELQFIRGIQNKFSRIKFYFWRTRDIEFEKVK